MIRERLESYRKKKQIFGYCKWADGRGLLFGRVERIDADEVHVALLDIDGTENDVDVVRLADFARIEESPAYAERLRLFTALPRQRKTKGQTTTSSRAIRARLTEAAKSGECVRLRLRDDSPHDFRVLRVEAETVDLAEYGDDPRNPIDRRLVTLAQIDELRWRSQKEALVTAVWRAHRKK